jgi:predicted nucleic acid-binding protein
MRLVLDTSAAANIVFKAEHSGRLMTLLEQADRVIAPALMHSEMGNALWKAVRFAALDTAVALSHYEHAIALVDEFIIDETLMRQAIRNAVRYAHPVYDMVFIAAAQQHGCRLLSVDKKLVALARTIDPDLILEL